MVGVQPTLQAFLGRGTPSSTSTTDTPEREPKRARIESLEKWRYQGEATLPSSSSASERRVPDASQGSSIVQPPHAASPPKDKVKYSPLEEQILQLKAQHPELLLMVEVGYKMKMYEADAHVASQILQIACYQEKNLMAAMIPVQRMNFHIKRLLAAGYKVGVCRQTQTRALKAATEKANKPFDRALTDIYTSSTWIDDLSTNDDSKDEQVLSAFVQGASTPTTKRFAMISVDMSSASVVYDEWEDDVLCSELETRVTHLRPRDVVLSSSTDERTKHLLRTFLDENARIEQQEIPANIPTLFADHLSPPTLAWAMDQSSLLQHTLALVLAFASFYRRTAALKHVSQYTPFSDLSSMRIPAASLYHLELFQNTTDGCVHGSLFWLMNECQTAMGRRILRKWIRCPLRSPAAIAQRADAVELLRARRLPILHRAISLLSHLPDLERGLVRLLYKLIQPTELATILLSLHRITHEFQDSSINTGSTLLDTLLSDLCVARDDISEWLHAIHIPSARQNDKVSLYSNPNQYPAMVVMQRAIEEDEKALQEHLWEIRRVLKRPSLQYLSVSGEENLIEVRYADVKSIPTDWVRVNATQRAVRFRSPVTVRLIRQREQHRELLRKAANESYISFITDLGASYLDLRRIVHAVACFDALYSLAMVASRPGYARPSIEANDDVNVLQLNQFRHPVTEALCSSYVPNDLTMGGSEAPRGVLITGSNMGGKSSTIRAIAVITIMAQMGSFVPCVSARLSCLDAVVTRMGARDDISRGKSTFMVEAEETAHILRTATPHTLVLLDEFGRGTSTFDGSALAEAVLRSFLDRGTEMPKLLFITHYLSLTHLVKIYPTLLTNKHMAVQASTSDYAAPSVVFLHKLLDGAASQSFGIHVAGMAGLPATITQQAWEIASSMEARHAQALRTTLARQCLRAIYQNNTSVLQCLHQQILP